MTDTTQKQLFKALLHINALDERKRTGRMDAAAQEALEEAEAACRSVSGGAMLTAFRAWRDGSVKAHDPTAGYSRLDVEQSPRNMQLQGRAR